MPTVEIRVEGKVQGVFYRSSVKEKARTLGLGGWVKNTEDGAVLIQASGAQAALDALKAWCAEGPPGARVHNIIEAQLPEEDFPDFRIVH